MPKPMWDELKFRKDQSFHRQTARLFNHDLLVDEFDLLVEKSRGLSIALLASRIIAWGSVFMIDLASVLAFGTSGPGPVSLPSRVHHRSSRYNSMSLCQRRVGVSTWGAIQLRLIRNLPLRICSAFITNQVDVRKNGSRRIRSVYPLRQKQHACCGLKRETNTSKHVSRSQSRTEHVCDVAQSAAVWVREKRSRP